MFSNAFFGVVALLYYLCFLSLIGLTIFIGSMGNSRTRRQAKLRSNFFFLAASVLSWQATVFIEVRTTLPVAQLWVGRFNFATVAFAVYFASRFVQQIPVDGSAAQLRYVAWLLAETGLVVAVTLFTPYVDADEQVVPGSRAVTIFGPLFPMYLIHVFSYLALTVRNSFRERRRVQAPMVRGQLGVVGFGLLATGSVAFVTNAVLPFYFADFRFCDIGTISVLAFVLAVAYATFVHRLFGMRIIVRETLVYGLMLAFVLGAYSSAVFVISQYLTDSTGKITKFAMLVITFSFDPFRRFLEQKTDRLLFGNTEINIEPLGRRRNRPRFGRHTALGLIFPWRR